MKKRNIGILLLISIVLFTTGCGKKIEIKNGSKVAVKVKGGSITATEYYEEIKKDNIVKLIDKLDHAILDKKYKSDDKENKEVEKQISQIQSYAGESEDQFNTLIKQYYGADSKEEFEKMLRLEYKRTQAVKDYVLKNVKEDEIKKYYEEKISGEIKASHILIRSEVDSDATDDEKKKAEEKALKEANEIIKKLESGEDFAKLAKKYSDDSSNASNGGDLGYIDSETVVEEFWDALKDLEKGKYTTEPIKTEYGYHIILKTGQKKKPTLKSVKEEVKEKIRDQKLKDDTSIYYEALVQIREDAKLTWNDTELKKAYDDYMNDLINKAKENSTTE